MEKEIKKEASIKSYLHEYEQTGILPLDWQIYKIKNRLSGEREGYYSKLFVNSPKLGSLSPEIYEPTTSGTLRGAKLAIWQMERALEVFDFLNYENRIIPEIGIRIPLKMFYGKTANQAFKEMVEEIPEVYARKICLCLTPESLFKDREEINDRMIELKEKGYKTALTGYGEEYFPFMRLKGMSFDYIYYTEEFTESLKTGVADNDALAKMAMAMGYKTIGMMKEGDGITKAEELREDFPATSIMTGNGRNYESLYGEVAE